MKLIFFLNHDTLAKLTDDQKSSIEGPLTNSECNVILKTFKSNKAPGNDGLTADFYKFFWPLIGSLMVDSFNTSFEKGEMSTSQKQSIICLIEKKGKDRLLVKNWRPISLLNCDYKIASKAIAHRITKHLSSLIHPNQCGFIKGRYIGEALRTLIDIMEITKTKDIEGLLISVDYEKAFDFLSWEFIFKVLECFNFGKDIIIWVKTFYKNISSCVMNNGNSSQYFEINRGVRQGDPLSPYLFLLSIEIMAHAVRQDNLIQGIKLSPNINIKLVQYADDTSVLLADIDSAKRFLDLLKSFTKCSGLKVNQEKTLCMWLGSKAESPESPLALCWSKSINILGITLSYNSKIVYNDNFQKRLVGVQGILNIWQNRNLTINGRIFLAKSLGYSQFQYVASVLTIPYEARKSLENILFQFVWKSRKKGKVKRSVLKAPYKFGGQNMIDVDSMIDAQKIMWIKRYMYGFNLDWISIIEHYFEKYGGLNFLLWCNYDLSTFVEIPSFYKDMLKIWKKVQFYNKLDILWNNKLIKIKGVTVFNKCLMHNGIWYATDLFDNGHPIPFRTWVDRGVMSNKHFLLWRALVQLGKSKINVKTHEPKIISCNILQNCKYLNKVISKDVYNQLRTEHISYTNVNIDYYSKYFNIEAEGWSVIYLLASRVTDDKKLQEFQYKILHRYLPVNSVLFKYQLVQDNLCTFCHLENETIIHLLYECELVKKLWDEIQAWLAINASTDLKLSPSNIILGDFTTPNILVNLITLLCKRYIFLCKSNNQLPVLSGLLGFLKFNYLVDKGICLKRSRIDSLFNRWEKLTNYFD